YRHAAPSAPWPWMDFNTTCSDGPTSPVNEFTDGTIPAWKTYPRNICRNWSSDQVTRSKILSSTSHGTSCNIYKVDVSDEGRFMNSDDGLRRSNRTVSVTPDRRPSGTRARALFVDNLSSEVLQMLGTRYRIGPSFFSCSTNWIPSRYQEDVKPSEGDHITIVLPFVRVVPDGEWLTKAASNVGVPPSPLKQTTPNAHVVDYRMPLLLHSTNHVLLQDLLAIHMVRSSTSSTIISHHPKVEVQNGSAQRLQLLVLKAGDSAYWSEVFAKSKDPTFVILVIFWYALYGWDEAFEVLSPHINWLEVYIFTTNDIYATQELHKLRASLLYYQQLLQTFRKSLVFLQTTPNPAMDALTEEERKLSADLMEKEVGNLLFEVDRLESQRAMLSSRLKNLIDLAFAMDNIEERKAATRDSATMKQAWRSSLIFISYLTMVFLPASFIASVFGMNVVEINPGSNENMAHYTEATIVVTLVTGWLLVAVQGHSSLHPPGSDIWRRLVWPAF
ncbi:hypothetical protein HYDPIDRAFT_58622, partial [Hydnomerulius pinastri MD-312]